MKVPYLFIFFFTKYIETDENFTYIYTSFFYKVYSLYFSKIEEIHFSQIYLSFIIKPNIYVLFTFFNIYYYFIIFFIIFIFSLFYIYYIYTYTFYFLLCLYYCRLSIFI